MRNHIVLMAATTVALAVSNGQVFAAQTISYDFTVDVMSGPLSGERYTGTTLVDLVGPNNSNETIKSASIMFDFGGVEFTELDDVQDPDANSPKVNFQDGEFLGHTFIVSRFGSHPTEIPLIQDLSIDGFAIDNSDFGYLVGTNVYRGTVKYSLPQDADDPEGPVQSVPEPSVWLGLATVGCSAGCGRLLTRRAG